MYLNILFFGTINKGIKFDGWIFFELTYLQLIKVPKMNVFALSELIMIIN